MTRETAPAITILMPAYNAAAYLRESIDSILHQTFTDFEFLIINDGSTDNSAEIIQSYNDPRIRYLENETNLRLIASLNKGIGLARGKYIARMDADDISLPERLELLHQFMETHLDVGLCGTGFETFSDDKVLKTVQYSPDHETICLKQLYQIHLSHGTCAFRTEVLKKHQILFNPDFSHAEDYELWSRISRVSKLANIQKVLYRVRTHEEKVSIKFSDTQNQNSLRVRKMNFQNIGVDLNEEQLLLFQKIAQHEYEPTAKFLMDAKVLLEWISAETTGQFGVSKEKVKQHAVQLWFNVCYNLTSLGMPAMKAYFDSPLASENRLGVFQQAKFLVKALLRK